MKDIVVRTVREAFAEVKKSEMGIGIIDMEDDVVAIERYTDLGRWSVVSDLFGVGSFDTDEDAIAHLEELNQQSAIVFENGILIPETEEDLEELGYEI